MPSRSVRGRWILSSTLPQGSPTPMQGLAAPRQKGESFRCAGYGRERSPRHIRRRLSDALFLTNWNLANYQYVVMSLATVDAHGCDLSLPLLYLDSTDCILMDALYPCDKSGYIIRCMYIHISAWALALSV